MTLELSLNFIPLYKSVFKFKLLITPFVYIEFVYFNMIIVINSSLTIVKYLYYIITYIV
jgi:hypothetical protein